jgi:hypothetical protein
VKQIQDASNNLHVMRHQLMILQLWSQYFYCVSKAVTQQRNFQTYKSKKIFLPKKNFSVLNQTLCLVSPIYRGY